MASKAINDVVAERQRQIDVEGYTRSHDDLHDPLEIARAGAAYALLAQSHPAASGDVPLGLNSGGVYIDWKAHAHLLWPWAGGPKSKDPRRDLVRAAALLIAAIERMDNE